MNNEKKLNYAFFQITILLALTVFLQTITQYTPRASEELPLIGKYIFN